MNMIFKKNIIVYMKDEGVNLNMMTLTIKFVMNCEFVGLEERFQGTCFGHAFSKASQYETIKEKVFKNFKYVSIKFAEFDLQKCITWPIFFKNRQEWNKGCIDFGICLKKLNIFVKTR